jgi:hypothetical protein
MKKNLALSHGGLATGEIAHFVDCRSRKLAEIALDVTLSALQLLAAPLWTQPSRSM